MFLFKYLGLKKIVTKTYNLGNGTIRILYIICYGMNVQKARNGVKTFK